MAGELAQRFLLNHPEMAAEDDGFANELANAVDAARAKRVEDQVNERVDYLAKNVPKKDGALDPDISEQKATPGPQTNEASALSDPAQTAQQFKDFAAYVGRLPKNLTAGSRDAVMHGMSLTLGDEAMTKADRWMREFSPGMYEVMEGMSERLETPDPVTQEITGFMVPFSAYFKAARAVGFSNIGAGIASDAAASFVNVDPHIERLSGLWAEADLSQADFWSFMADTDDTNRDVLDRVKNGIENVALGVGIAGAWEAVRGVRSMARGDFDWSKFESPAMGAPQAQAGMIDVGGEVAGASQKAGAK